MGFDKSRGSGGRMATKKLGDASWDMGAQFMRAHSEAFTRQLQQWQKAGLISEWPVQPGMVDMQGDAVIAPSADQVTRYVGMKNTHLIILKDLLITGRIHGKKKNKQ